jgi:hypothetical protein
MQRIAPAFFFLSKIIFGATQSSIMRTSASALRKTVHHCFYPLENTWFANTTLQCAYLSIPNIPKSLAATKPKDWVHGETYLCTYLFSWKCLQIARFSFFVEPCNNSEVFEWEKGLWFRSRKWAKRDEWQPFPVKGCSTWKRLES